jgi:hypothetical protein
VSRCIRLSGSNRESPALTGRSAHNEHALAIGSI